MPLPRYDGYIFDLDGTIYLGDRTDPGCPRDRGAHPGRRAGSGVSLQQAAGAAGELCPQTDTPGHPDLPEDVINSTQALMHLLREAEPGARLYVVGERKLVQELRDAGFQLTRAA